MGIQGAGGQPSWVPPQRQLVGSLGYAPQTRLGALKARARGAVVAAALSAVVVWIANPQSIPPQPTPDWMIAIPCLLAAAIGGWLFGSRVLRATKSSIVLMALATYVVLILLLPLVPAVTAAPGATNGGAIPCLDIRFGSSPPGPCPKGLHGSEALNRLVSETATFYVFAPFSLVIFSPLLILLLLLSAVWAWITKLLRRAPRLA
jgi:ABC-type branched-subunit amino acid transport system permease subunit